MGFAQFLRSVGTAVGRVVVAPDETEALVGEAIGVATVIEPFVMEDVEIDVEGAILQAGEAHGEVDTVAASCFEGEAEGMQCVWECQRKARHR